ncbi:NifU family protein [Crocinitomix catalasitica]|nr:NifU family protein [Crocinitomix catalasitica]
MDKIARIQTALDAIRPYLQKDGGDVEFIELTKDYVLKIKLLGACETCSMSAMTLRAGIEESIKNVVPEVVEVQAI